MGLSVYGKREISILPYGNSGSREGSRCTHWKTDPPNPAKHMPPEQTSSISPAPLSPLMPLMCAAQGKWNPLLNSWMCKGCVPMTMAIHWQPQRPTQELTSSRGHPLWAGPLDHSDSKGAGAPGAGMVSEPQHWKQDEPLSRDTGRRCVQPASPNQKVLLSFLKHQNA